MVDAIPLPPVDAAGGIMVLEYSNGTDTHRCNLHVRGMADDIGTYSPPPIGPAVGVGARNEVTVADTFTQYGVVWANFFPAAWKLTMAAFYRNDNFGGAGPGNMREIFPVPTGTAIAGVSAGSEPANSVYRAGMTVFNSRSKNGGKARFVLIGSNFWSAVMPSVIAANAGGDQWQKFVEYVTSTTTGICCHDGSQAMGPMHLTTPYSKKLRTSYGFA